MIHGLLRQDESANLIAPSKVGKSWLVTDLALSLATGWHWLGIFETERGNVLILDNELHVETSTNRIPKVAKARNIPLAEIADCVFVDNLRGRLKDIFSLASYFHALQLGFFRIIVMDALYRYFCRRTRMNTATPI
jgi:RecA-family ATPase